MSSEDGWGQFADQAPGNIDRLLYQLNTLGNLFGKRWELARRKIILVDIQPEQQAVKQLRL